MEVGTPGVLAGSKEAFQGHSWGPALSSALAGSRGHRGRSRLSAADTGGRGLWLAECPDAPSQAGARS